MPYMHDPMNRPVDRIRLNVGDIWPDIEILGDTDYEYFLFKNHGSESRATIDAARTILFTLARYTRERTGDIEVYGAEWFNNYRKAIEDLTKNPELSLSLAVPFAGGIDKIDMFTNNLHWTRNSVHSPDKQFDPLKLRLGCGAWNYNYGVLGGAYYGAYPTTGY